VSRERGQETGSGTTSWHGLKGFVGLGLVPSRCVGQHDCLRKVEYCVNHEAFGEIRLRNRQPFPTPVSIDLANNKATTEFFSN